MERKIIHVVGTGTIGEPLIGLLCDYQEQLGIDEITFFKNSPLHDGAIIIENNTIVATRVILPVSESNDLPSIYGLRHRAALGITEKTDSIVVVISEQTGKIVYFKGGEFIKIKSSEMLNEMVIQDLNK